MLIRVTWASAMMLGSSVLAGCGPDDNSRFGQPDVLPPLSGVVTTAATTGAGGGGGAGGAGPNYLCDPMATLPAMCPTYTADIQPYIKTACSDPNNCHLATAQPIFDGPDSHAVLSAHVKAGLNYFDTVDPTQSWFLCNLDLPTQTGPVPATKMPLGTQPTPAERQMLGEWVLCGMLDD